MHDGMHIRLQVAAAFHALSLDDVIGAIQGPRMGPIRGEHFLSPSWWPFGEVPQFWLTEPSDLIQIDELLDA